MMEEGKAGGGGGSDEVHPGDDGGGSAADAGVPKSRESLLAAARFVNAALRYGGSPSQVAKARAIVDVLEEHAREEPGAPSGAEMEVV